MDTPELVAYTEQYVIHNSLIFPFTICNPFRLFTASLSRPVYGSGECCGTSGSFLSGYGSSGYGNGITGGGYNNGLGSRPIYTNVVPDYVAAGGYGPGGYNRPSYGSNYRPSGSLGYNRGYTNRPSYGLPGFPLNGGYGDYLSGGYGSFPGGDIIYRR